MSDASEIGKHPGKGMSAVAADFDRDGNIDVFATSDRMFAFLFRNRGNGRFEESAFNAGVAVPDHGSPVSGMGVDAQDFDNDGLLDLVYTAPADETFPLHRGTPDGFLEMTARTKLAVLSRPMSGWGIAFADLDNDGWRIWLWLAAMLCRHSEPRVRARWIPLPGSATTEAKALHSALAGTLCLLPCTAAWSLRIWVMTVAWTRTQRFEL